MRRFYSIVFLFILFFSQYGKLASYSYCKIKATVKAVNCDCEKKWLTDQNSSPNTAQVILKQNTDEVYLKTNSFNLYNPTSYLTEELNNTSDPVVEGFHPSLFHPPSI
jgi:hypothetical protein